MPNASEDETTFERDNPFASGPIAVPAVLSGVRTNLFGATGHYLVEGRELQVYWSHWTGWEAYAMDGRSVAEFRNWSLRRRHCIELDSRSGRTVEIESAVTPDFVIRIWSEGQLLLQDVAPSKRGFDFAIAALLASCIATIWAFVGGWV